MTQDPGEALGWAGSARAAPGVADQLADLVSAAAEAVDGVAAVRGGPGAEVATYLPGRRVPGVRISESRVEVHIAVSWLANVLATAAAVRQAVAPLVNRPVHVFVDDVVPPSWQSPGPG